jgi:hypothetical protein
MYINQQSFIYTRSQKNQQDTDLYLQIDKIINTRGTNCEKGMNKK